MTNILSLEEIEAVLTKLIDLDFVEDGLDEKHSILASHKALLEENTKLRQALEVYAKEANWMRLSDNELGKRDTWVRDVEHGFTLAQSVLTDIKQGETK